MFESLSPEERPEGLAAAYQAMANVLAQAGNLPAAISLYDKSLDIAERLVNQENRWELAEDLAGLYHGKASATFDAGKLSEALVLFDKALKIWKNLVDQGQLYLSADLAAAHHATADVLAKMGKHAESIAHYDQAIMIRELQIREEDCLEINTILAQTKADRAEVVKNKQS
jgi:tetratricopeptide (TPR) repeat protein